MSTNEQLLEKIKQLEDKNPSLVDLTNEQLLEKIKQLEDENSSLVDRTVQLLLIPEIVEIAKIPQRLLKLENKSTIHSEGLEQLCESETLQNDMIRHMKLNLNELNELRKSLIK